MEKNKWVAWQLSKFTECRKDVIQFIADTLFHQGNDNSEVIRTLFHAGYCYYFALMLENAFGGKVCWHKGCSHIVWMDETECRYDIERVFYDYNEGNIVPVSELDDGLEGFRHRIVK